MTGALLSFCAMAVAIRKLWGPLTIMEILALRAALGLAIIAVVAAFRPDERRSITVRRLPLHILRNGVHFGAQYLWALGLVLLPLATVFALEFTMPAWTILLAPFFLGERMTRSRVGAVILGLIGVLVILRQYWSSRDTSGNTGGNDAEKFAAIQLHGQTSLRRNFSAILSLVRQARAMLVRVGFFSG